MNITEAIARAQTKRPGPKCMVGKLLDDLDPADAETLQTILDDATVRHSAIAVGMTELGHRLTREAVRRHRGEGTDVCVCNANR